MLTVVAMMHSQERQGRMSLHQIQRKYSHSVEVNRFEAGHCMARHVLLPMDHDRLSEVRGGCLLCSKRADFGHKRSLLPRGRITYCTGVSTVSRSCTQATTTVSPGLASKRHRSEWILCGQFACEDDINFVWQKDFGLVDASFLGEETCHPR